MKLLFVVLKHQAKALVKQIHCFRSNIFIANLHFIKTTLSLEMIIVKSIKAH